MSERCDHGRADGTMCPWCQQTDHATKRRDLPAKIVDGLEAADPYCDFSGPDGHEKMLAAIERVLEQEGK